MEIIRCRETERDCEETISATGVRLRFRGHSRDTSKFHRSSKVEEYMATYGSRRNSKLATLYVAMHISIALASYRPTGFHVGILRGTIRPDAQ